MAISFSVAAGVPKQADVLGVPVFAGRRLAKGSPALDADYLAERGFEGKVGEACPVPDADAPSSPSVWVRPSR